MSGVPSPSLSAVLVFFRVVTIRGRTSGHPTPGEIQLRFGLRHLFRAHPSGPGPHSGCAPQGLALVSPPAQLAAWGLWLSVSTSAPCRAAQSHGPPHLVPARDPRMGHREAVVLVHCGQRGVGPNLITFHSKKYLIWKSRIPARLPKRPQSGLQQKKVVESGKKNPQAHKMGFFVTVITYY